MKHVKGLLYCVITWYVISIIFGIDKTNTYIIPMPHVVIYTLFTNLNIVYDDFLISLFRLMSGLFLASIFGIIIGISLGTKEKLNKTISPVVHALHPIPKGALTPVFIAMFGLGEWSKILIVMCIAIFPIIINIKDSLRNLDPIYYLSAKNINLSTKDYYKQFILKSIYPELLTTLKIAIGTGVAVLYLSETVASNKGLGYLIAFNNGVNKNMMFVGILLLSLIGYILVMIVTIIEEKYKSKIS